MNKKFIGSLLITLAFTANALSAAQSVVGNTALHEMASKSDAQGIRDLIASGAGVNATNANGDTPLHIAAESGRVNNVKALLEAGADFNIMGRFEHTPLHWAARNGHFECVQELVTAGSDITLQNRQNYTPAMLAALHGHQDIVALFASLESPASSSSSSSSSSLSSAPSSSSWSSLNSLTSSSSSLSVEPRNSRPSQQKEFGYDEFLDQQRGFSQSASNQFNTIYGTFGVATQKRESDRSVSSLFGITNEFLAISREFDQFSNANFPSFAAIELRGESGYSRPSSSFLPSSSSPEFARSLRYSSSSSRSSSSVREFGHDEFLESLSSNEFLESRRRLILNLSSSSSSSSSNIDPEKSKAMLASQENTWTKTFECSSELLPGKLATELAQNKKDVNLLHRGETPLSKCFSLLFAYGTSPFYVEKLHQCLNLLINAGAPVDLKNSDGQTALHKAAQLNLVESITILLVAGASVDAQDNNGRTPLYYAAWRGNVAAIELLVQKGASINTPDNEGKKPIDLASDFATKAFLQQITDTGNEAFNVITKDAENDICPICFEGYQEGSHCITLGCGHDFCESCITM